METEGAHIRYSTKRLVELSRLTGENAGVIGGAARAQRNHGSGARPRRGPTHVPDLDPAGAHTVAAELERTDQLALEIDMRSTESVREAADAVTDRLRPPSILSAAPASSESSRRSRSPTRTGTSSSTSNSDGHFRCCRAFSAAMVVHGRGAMVNVASLTGVEFGGSGRVPYGASKGGVSGPTRALTMEMASYGVRVNAVAPGIVATPMVQGLAADGSLDLDGVAARCRSGGSGRPTTSPGSR